MAEPLKAVVGDAEGLELLGERAGGTIGGIEDRSPVC